MTLRNALSFIILLSLVDLISKKMWQLGRAARQMTPLNKKPFHCQVAAYFRDKRGGNDILIISFTQAFRAAKNDGLPKHIAGHET